MIPSLSLRIPSMMLGLERFWVPPVLDDPLVFSGGGDHLAALEEVVRAGFFDIHILARLAGPDRRQRVPAISQAVGHRIDRLIVKHLPHVAVDGQLLAFQIRIPLAGRLKLALVTVADGHDLHVLLGHLSQCANV